MSSAVHMENNAAGNLIVVITQRRKSAVKEMVKSGLVP